MVLALVAFGDAQAAPALDGVRRVVILVPGTLNSLPPGGLHENPVSQILELNPYFSNDVIGAFESRGLGTYVVRHLSWFAQFEANGEVAMREMRAWYDRYFPAHEVPITLVGHSAGGFYALYAAAHARDLPIRKVIVVSTPLEGAELGDAVFEYPAAGRILTEICERTGGLFDLRGLSGMTARAVGDFLSRLSLDPGLEIDAVSGSQPLSYNPLEQLKAQNLSPVFVPSGTLIRERGGVENDGVISVRSSQGAHALIRDDLGRPMPIHRPGIRIALDHPEQVLDYRVFGAMGTRDAGFIRDEQKRVYGGLAQLAE